MTHQVVTLPRAANENACPPPSLPGEAIREGQWGRVVEVDGVKLGDLVAFTSGGRTRRGYVLRFTTRPGEPARARLMVAPGYVDGGAYVTHPVSKLEAV
ncbi:MULTISPECIES: hypothetical protein [unclassified Oceanicaulis]|uniref:hypothetical protein n=1 Tax=unclassified Oceanicaulis TaxID=2632123 RepID=UPI0025F07504|nr:MULTISPECIES: hypothetical protein [unclassified Oceanicaulis]|tara:strand:- start:489 stop:785 length:297 start_codon:yes stop_codon:yes gene_type:complete